MVLRSDNAVQAAGNVVLDFGSEPMRARDKVQNLWSGLGLLIRVKANGISQTI